MLSNTILSVVSILYIFCSVFYFSNIFLRVKWLERATTTLTVLSFLAHTIAFGVRWVETYRMGLGHFHVVTLYESLAFIAWAVIGSYLIVEMIYKNKTIGGFVVPMAAVMMVYASMFSSVDNAIKPVPEVLQGNFYNYHVIPCFFAYAAFAISCGASIIFLFKRKKKPEHTAKKVVREFFPSVNVLDSIMYKSIAIGFIFFTIQMVAGMFRTKIIWGNYWEWDPTQIFGLMTWLIYATILHGRYMRWWGGNKTAILSIIGFFTSVWGFLAAAGRMFTTGHYPIL